MTVCIVDAKRNNCQLRLIPSLSARALRIKRDKELALWYCLRSLNSEGSGVLDVATAVDSLCEHYHYSKPTIYRLLATGEGTFWRRTKNHQQLLLTGVSQLVKALHVGGDYLDRYFRLEVGEFNTLAKRRAALFASTLKPWNVKSKPIARQTIEGITGINKRQQRRYDNAAGIKGVPCYEVAKATPKCSIKVEADTNRKPVYSITGAFKGVETAPKYSYRRRLPNIYHTRQLSQPQGMLKRSIKRCRVLVETERLQAPVKSRFTSWKGLHKAFRGGLELGHVLLPRALRLIPGRLEWSLEVNITNEPRMAGL